jgi:hypothetical protein
MIQGTLWQTIVGQVGTTERRVCDTGPESVFQYELRRDSVAVSSPADQDAPQRRPTRAAGNVAHYLSCEMTGGTMRRILALLLALALVLLLVFAFKTIPRIFH